jgi:three-Cys-motif partner protein
MLVFRTVTLSNNLDDSDDGLPCSEVGNWAEEKHEIVARYATQFSTAMKNKWGCRVYLDLYAGPGLLRIKNTNNFIWGSSIHALKIRDPFTKYILCEKKAELLQALKTRVSRKFPDADVEFVAGNCDEKIDEILNKIPRRSRSRGVLCFCFVDPFDLSFKFATLRKLSENAIDFLILISDMDAIRAQPNYLNPENTKIDEMLGMSDWRERWLSGGSTEFPRFLSEQLSAQMKSLGYLETSSERMKKVKSSTGPLYRLALYSRSARAHKLWDEVLKYSGAQRKLNFTEA